MIDPAKNEFWKDKRESIKYIPLQAEKGDLAIYIQNPVFEIEFIKEKFIVIPQSAILLFIRDKGMDI